MCFCSNAAGDDYRSGVHNVTLAARMTSVQISVTIKDDTILESQEEFKLTILSLSLSETLIIGSPGEAIVTVIDNDCKLYPLW